MNVLILSFYYYPDLCPGSFRCKALVEQLQKESLGQYNFDVITTLPNRYASFEVEAAAVERHEGLNIHRIQLPAHHSGMLDQAKAFAIFAKKVNQLVKDKNYALVFATSSRLMTALLGAFIAQRKHAKLYLDIRDIFTDTLDNILPSYIARGLNPVISLLEKWAFLKASRINFNSKGFEEYVTARYPTTNLSWFTNGVDDDFITVSFPDITAGLGPLKVLYAGNMGEGQGLHHIIPVLAKRMEGKIVFRLIGDGGRKTQLMEEIERQKCTNIELLPPVSRQELVKEYQNTDILFLHLNDYAAFRKVLPSKLFEYAATGKPIWAGVAGYAEKFIDEEIDNAAVFPPCNEKAAEQSFHELKLTTLPRIDFIKKYKRQTIMQAMAQDVLSVIRD